MDLDIRTIMVMFAVLGLMFAGLLELAGLHAGDIRGVRQWAVANLCISLGLSLSYLFITPSPGFEWAVVVGATLVSAGIILQYTGIQAFKDMHSDWRVVALVIGLTLALNLWFAVLKPDVAARAMSNSLLFALCNAACARELLIRIDPPSRSAYWFTGLSFSLLAIVLLARAVFIGLSPSESYSLYAQMPINPLTFFIACLVQLCVTFGFVLMLNYRLVMNVQKLASRDVLTGAFNRRRLEEEAVHQWGRCLRTGDALSVMMMDVDHFKSINDRYGHPTGDEVLRRLVAIAQATIRADDYFARYGGEEFCILMPSTTEQEALILAERLRANYEAATMEFGGNSLKSTISVGVADSTRVNSQFASLVAAADQALYRAKEAGRNRVVSYSSVTAT